MTDYFTALGVECLYLKVSQMLRVPKFRLDSELMIESIEKLLDPILQNKIKIK